MVAALTSFFPDFYCNNGIGASLHLPTARRDDFIAATFTSYVQLLGDRRFMAPAMGGLAVGGLLAFFAYTPCHSDGRFGPDPIELLLFAVTVFVVRRRSHGEVGDPLNALVVA